jgi:hypothetical protein
MLTIYLEEFQSESNRSDVPKKIIRENNPIAIFRIPFAEKGLKREM